MRRLRFEHRTDVFVCHSKALLGFIHLAKIGANRYALNARHAHIGITHFQSKLRIVPGIVRESSKVLQRGVNDRLPCGSVSRHLSSLEIDIKQLAG